MNKFLKFLILALLLLPANAGAELIGLDENHIQLSPGVIWVGENIAYQDEDGRYHPSSTRIQIKKSSPPSYYCDTAKLKFYFKDDLTSSWPIELKSGKHTLRIQPLSLSYYNSKTGALREVVSVKKGDLLYKEDKLSYNEVFSQATMNFLSIKEGLAQKLILFDRETISVPAPGEDYFGLMNKLDLSGLLSPWVIYARTGESENSCLIGSNLSGIADPEYRRLLTPELVAGTTDHTSYRRIRIEARDGDTPLKLFRFSDAPVNDSYTGDLDRHTHPLKIIKQDEKGDCYLLQLIPVSWLKTAEFPITFGWQLQGGEYKNYKEVFSPGNTYVVEGIYDVKSLKSLGTPEKPVFVKFVPQALGGSRIATKKLGGEGAKVEYTVFTSLLDNRPGSGAKVDPSLFGLEASPPQAGDYTFALYLAGGKGSCLKNSTIAYAQVGVSAGTVGDIIFDEGRLTAVENVLFEDCREAGLVSVAWPSFRGNTVRNCNQGVRIVRPDSSAGEVLNSVFTENKTCGASSLAAAKVEGNIWSANAKDNAGGSIGPADRKVENPEKLTEDAGFRYPFKIEG